MKTIPEINIHVPADKTLVRIPYGTSTRYGEFEKDEILYIDSYIPRSGQGGSDGNIDAVLVSLSSGKICKMEYDVLQTISKSEYEAIINKRSEPDVSNEMNNQAKVVI